MANIRKQAIDKTYLSLDQAEERGFIHRDYIAHCFRWSHVCKLLQQNRRYLTTRLLDVGCGRELPLAKLLYSSRLIVELYVGIDYGPVEKEAIDKFSGGKFPLNVLPKCDFSWFAEGTMDKHGVSQFTNEPSGSKKYGQSYGNFNMITCFEVLEHVEPRHMISMLRHMKSLLTDDGLLVISTPCYDEKTGAADNHVNEITHLALGAVLENEGWGIQACYGTFASIKDYKDLIKEDGLEELFERMRGYFDTNVLSNIFANLYPSHSRNNLWRLVKATPDYVRKFPKLEDCPTPWGSSELWKELAS